MSRSIRQRGLVGSAVLLLSALPVVPPAPGQNTRSTAQKRSEAPPAKQAESSPTSQPAKQASGEPTTPSATAQYPRLQAAARAARLRAAPRRQRPLRDSGAHAK